MYNFQNEKPNNNKADARRYGRSDSINDNPPKKLADVPNTMKIAGPMQHEAAKNEANIVPKLDRFSVFMLLHPFYDPIIRPCDT
jgi:hypothetical protein